MNRLLVTMIELINLKRALFCFLPCGIFIKIDYCRVGSVTLRRKSYEFRVIIYFNVFTGGEGVQLKMTPWSHF